MYTKTVLHPSTIEAMNTDPRAGNMFVTIMQDRRAVLLLGKEELRSWEAKLPMRTYKTLEHSITNRRIRWRLREGTINEKTMSPSPEVVVTETDHEIDAPWLWSDMIGFSECLPVARRNSLLDGKERTVHRDEFWKWALLPTIEAFEPKGRTLDIIDQYLFNDFRRNLTQIGRKNGPSQPSDIAIVWLLQTLDTIGIDGNRRLLVRIVTAEKTSGKTAMSDRISRDEIVDLFNELLTHCACANLEIDLLIVPGRMLTTSREGFIARKIVVNGQVGFTLGHGLGDLTRTVTPEGSVDDKASTSWAFCQGFNVDHTTTHRELMTSVPAGYSYRIE